MTADYSTLVLFDSFDDFCLFLCCKKNVRRQTKKSHECDAGGSRTSWLESDHPRAAPPRTRGPNRPSRDLVKAEPVVRSSKRGSPSFRGRSSLPRRTGVCRCCSPPVLSPNSTQIHVVHPTFFFCSMGDFCIALSVAPCKYAPYRFVGESQIHWEIF